LPNYKNRTKTRSKNRWTRR